MAKQLTFTLAQLNPIVGDVDYNSDKIIKTWKEAETDLVVFPELFLSGYPPEDLILKPSFLNTIEDAVSKFVKASEKLNPAALIPCPWRDGGKTFNVVHLIENGQIIATIKKHHLPNYGVFDEARTFTPGPMPNSIPFRGVKLGVMICEDLWFPDVAAHLKKQGAEILIAPHASPFDHHKSQNRHKIAQARVSETDLPLILLNQIGGQDELVFDGASFVMNAKGETVLRMTDFEEATNTIAFPPHPSSPSAQIPSPSRERAGPAKREGEGIIYAALTLGLRDYIQKNNFPGILLGLSGGVDSALAARIAVDAIGADKVHCVMMPSRYTSQDSLDDAATLAKNLGVKYDIIPIEKPVDAFHDILKPHLPVNAPSITFENIQPRARGLILMTLSNAGGKMVLSTGNKSEMAVGYATLYGDMCGGFNILKDVYKTQVYALTKWRNHDAAIPERIITRAPTAELKDNQTDQDSLPPYEELDAILACLIEQDLGVEETIKAGHNPETVAKVPKMLQQAEYKRRQAPPGVKITSRAFGRDRRYPITNKA